MSARADNHGCERTDLVAPYALDALAGNEAAAMQSHLAACAACRKAFESLRPVTDALAAWRIDVLPPSTAMWSRLLDRIAAHPRTASASSPRPYWPAPEWEDVAPGIQCKLLSTDAETDRVSMLVRLAPGASYPAHSHAGTEELYLLHGELWIDDRKLATGDYNRAEQGTVDRRIWSGTGCTCLLITSPSDQLG